MPFMGNVDGILVDVASLDEMTFQALQNITCPECDASLRKKSGLKRRRHFFHPKNVDCNFAKMSNAHASLQAALKSIIDQTENWQGYIEFRADNWRGDVVAKNIATQMMISFEIQLSGINTKEAIERTERHKQSGVHEVIWITNRNVLTKCLDLAIARVDVNKSDIASVDVQTTYPRLPSRNGPPDSEDADMKQSPLQSFIAKILSRQLCTHFRDKIVVDYRNSYPQIRDVNRYYFETPAEYTDRPVERLIQTRREQERKDEQERQKRSIERDFSIKFFTAGIETTRNSLVELVKSRVPNVVLLENETLAGGLIARLNNQTILIQPNVAKLDAFEDKEVFRGNWSLLVDGHSEKEYLERKMNPFRIYTKGDISQSHDVESLLFPISQIMFRGNVS